MNDAALLLEPAAAGRRALYPEDEIVDRGAWPGRDKRQSDDESEACDVPSATRVSPVVVEADQIILRAGEAMLILNRANGGTLEIRAPHVLIRGTDVTSEAEMTNTLAGGNVIAEAVVHADVLGKLIRINGQCVKINC